MSLFDFRNRKGSKRWSKTAWNTNAREDVMEELN